MSPLLIYYWLAAIFILGTVVGSFINVVIARLPLERSLIWPGSRCGSCFQDIRWYDNIPILSYLWLRGRCRTCGQGFSAGYLGVELVTGLLFAGLFYLEVVLNIHNWPDLGPRGGVIVVPWSWPLILGFMHHAVLLTFLISASGCDLQGREIPFPLTLTGTLIGLMLSMPFAWPWPSTNPLPAPVAWPPSPLPEGIYAWPIWWPLPSWLPAFSWYEGLATGLAGALMGTFLLRAIGFIFGIGAGKEGLGLGDADLMMMVGSFLGWQMVLVAFFVSVGPGLFFGIFQALVRKDNSLPFGPSLAAGSMITCLCWGWIGPKLQILFFWDTMMLILAAASAVFFLGMSLLLRVLNAIKR